MCAVTRPLTIPLGNLDRSAIPQRAQEAEKLPSHVLSSGVAGGEGPNLEPVATSGAMLFLQGVKETPGGFPLLKSIAECLCFVLGSCEVWPRSHICSVMLMAFPANGGE